MNQPEENTRMQTNKTQDGWIGRRTYLTGIGAGIVASSSVGIVTAKNNHGNRGFPPRKHTDWGESAAVGNGEIRTFVTVPPSGKPTFVGVYFTAGLLDGLPPSGTDGKFEHPPGTVPCCGYETVLDFPASIETTAYKWFMLNWNPEGHPPPHVYTAPHFDFHFYTMPGTKRADIENGICERDGELHFTAVTCETLDRGTEPLPVDQQPPAEYTSLKAVEPGMGDHLMDMAAPEWNGEPFTHTWLWGAFDGEIIFHEPMITKAFFARQYEEVRTPMKMPAAFPEAGWYPTEYVIRYLGGQDAYTVTLESFEWFPKSNGRL